MLVEWFQKQYDHVVVSHICNSQVIHLRACGNRLSATFGESWP